MFEFNFLPDLFSLSFDSVLNCVLIYTVVVIVILLLFVCFVINGFILRNVPLYLFNEARLMISFIFILFVFLLVDLLAFIHVMSLLLVIVVFLIGQNQFAFTHQQSIKLTL